MKTNTAIIGLVLVVSLTACGALIYYGMQEETITVEVDLKNGAEPYCYEYRGERNIIVDCFLIYTSSTGKDVRAESVPDLVIIKDGVERVLHQRSGDSISIVPSPEHPCTLESGYKLSTKISYPVDRYIDMSEYTYCFQLSQQMIDAGNYKLAERGLQTLPDW
jgi:hypothetical protein